jgi:AsmA protein
MRLLKYALLGSGALILVLGAVLAYLAATFDPSQYKPQIVQAVKDRTGRTLTLAGDIEIAFYPSLGARVRTATLSERGNDRPFASVDELRVSVKLMPLLSKNVIVDAVSAKGLKANIVRYKDGRTNYEDLAGAPPAGRKPAPEKPASTPVNIDIARVQVEDASVSYIDQLAGTKYEVSRLTLETGRIASGVPSNVQLAFLVRSDNPKLNLDSKLKTRLTFDAAQKRLAVEALEFAAKGSAADISELVASARGDIEARPDAAAFSASKVAITAKGKRQGDDLSFKLDMPQVQITRDKVSADRIVLDANTAGAKNKLSAKVEIPAAQGTAKQFTAGQLAAHVDMQQDGASTRIKITSPVTGSVEHQQIQLPKLVAAVTVSNPKIPRKSIDAALNGALAVDIAKQSANLTFATKFDESAINGRAGLTKFAAPAYTFDINVDRLDADLYMQKAADGKVAPSGSQQGQASEQPIDLSPLKALNANGALRFGTLKVSNVKTSNVRLDIKAADGRVDVNPLTANLYQGSLAGAISINAAAAPVFAVQQKITGVDLGPLLRDLAENDMLEGKGTVALDVTAQGHTVAAIKKALNGTASLRVTDGALKGINIAGSIRSAKARLGTLRGEQVQQANKTEKTDFSELNATFAIKSGVAHNNDLSMKSPLLRVGGEGQINVGHDTIDYLIKAAIVGTSKGQGGRELADLQGVTVPVRVSGPLDAPSYKLDFAALATDAARQKVESTVRDQLERRLGTGAKEDKASGGSRLGDQLKGLFGR